MILGIVGSEGKKFTFHTEAKARELILSLIDSPRVTGITSGACHLGGIDVWAEEIANDLHRETFIYPPKNLQWSTGYKPRNIQIATKADELHCITIKEYPPRYKGMRFDSCYHCKTDAHIKSGGCWTLKYAAEHFGKPVYWHVI